MNKRIILSLIIGTLLLFVWNAISWMALPFHSQSLKNIPEGIVQLEAMRLQMPEDGVYHYPGLPGENTSKTLDEIEHQLQQGPRITLMVYRNHPTALFDPSTFLYSLLINLLTAGLTLTLISFISQPTAKTVILATLTLGVIAAVVSDVSQMNWYMFPLGYTLVNVGDKLISFGLLSVLFAFYTFKTPQHAR
ncbi:MAG: hypothetical protein AAGI38_12150 [Bacteroidota bacterium]